MTRTILSVLAVLAASTGLAHAETDPEKIAKICQEAEERYVQIYGHPSAEEEGVTVALMYKYTFCPVTLEVPVGTRIKLRVNNLDATPEEFESYELNREKIVPANGRVVIFVGPLKPGRYEFFGEFNMATARGSLIAR